MTPNQPNRIRAFADQIECLPPPPPAPPAPELDHLRLGWVDRICLAVLFAAAAAILSFYSVAVFGQTTQPTTQPVAAPDFIVGVFKQPANSAAKWRARGINTAFFWEEERNSAGVPTMPQSTWRKAWRDAGGVYVDGVGSDPAIERADGNLIALGQGDEADRRGVPAPALISTYDAWRAAIGKPVAINLDGHQYDNVAYDGTPHLARPLNDPQHYGHRAATSGYLAAGDWVGFDYYLWPERPELWFIHERLLDRTWEWGGHKPILLYIELGQSKGVTSITTVEQLALHAVTYCARKGYVLRGIVFFPQRVTTGMSFAYDDTAPAVAAGLPNLIAKLTGGKLSASAPPSTAPVVVTPPPATPPTLEDRVGALEAWRRTVVGGNP